MFHGQSVHRAVHSGCFGAACAVVPLPLTPATTGTAPTVAASTVRRRDAERAGAWWNCPSGARHQIGSGVHTWVETHPRTPPARGPAVLTATFNQPKRARDMR
ncbi:hypothetical protein [Streptomyces luteogriseus]|uniref:hypothetical protein n=1 Tax=Streptomyces luteogriseus TaxID=68233 RepID=UPI0037F2E29B